MKRKIIKYTKFIVSMVLILGLVAPSYASLSASDGSAFVTKAEFDSALADFNSRLTTFEAGINSKIDSQVTSYLDRNGIWNGKVQTLTTNYIFERWINKATGREKDGVTYYPTWYPKNVAAGDSMKLPKWKEGDKNIIGKMVTQHKNETRLVANFNKTGLLVLGYNTYPVTDFFGLSGDNFKAIWETTGTNILAVGRYVASFYAISATTRDNKGTIELSTINAVSTEIQVIPKGSGGFLFFFVSKGDELVVETDFSAAAMSGGGALMSEKQSAVGPMADEIGVITIFDEPSVY